MPATLHIYVPLLLYSKQRPKATAPISQKQQTIKIIIGLLQYMCQEQIFLLLQSTYRPHFITHISKKTATFIYHVLPYLCQEQTHPPNTTNI